MSKSGIDGIVIKSRSSILKEDKIKEFDKNSKVDEAEDSDEGSSYNIFGSNELLISEEVR